MTFLVAVYSERGEGSNCRNWNSDGRGKENKIKRVNSEVIMGMKASENTVRASWWRNRHPQPRDGLEQTWLMWTFRINYIDVLK